MSHRSPAPSLRLLTGRQIQWIAAGFLLTFASLPGQTIFIAQFNSAIRGVFDLSHGEFGLIYTVATLASSVCLVFVGGLTDKFPIKNLAIICVLGLAVVAVGISRVNHVIFLVLALFGLRFFGQGMMTQIAGTAMSRWFNRFRGRALAISHVGFPLGDAILPLTAAFLILTIGWRNVWLCAAGLLIVGIIPCIIWLLRDAPDGANAAARGDVNPDATEGEAATGAQWNRAAVLKDKLFYCILLGMMVPPAVTTLFFFHQAHLAEIKGWEVLSFAKFFPLFSLFSFIVAIIAGAMIDRFGATRLLVIVLVPEGIACVLIGLIDPFWVLPMFFIAIGVTHGIMSPLFSALWAEIYGTTHIGAIRALSTSGTVLASALGPGIAGSLIDVGFELPAQSFVYGGFCFVGAIGFTLLQPALQRRKNAL